MLQTLLNNPTLMGCLTAIVIALIAAVVYVVRGWSEELVTILFRFLVLLALITAGITFFIICLSLH